MVAGNAILLHRPAVLGLLAALWVALALHTALAMRRNGRRWWVWFIVSVLLTVIPAAVVSYVDYFAQLRRRRERAAEGGENRRCPHCAAELTERDVRRVGGKLICARCGMVIEDAQQA